MNKSTKKRKVRPWEDDPDEEPIDPAELTMADLCKDLKRGRKSKTFKELERKRYEIVRKKRLLKKATSGASEVPQPSTVVMKDVEENGASSLSTNDTGEGAEGIMQPQDEETRQGDNKQAEEVEDQGDETEGTIETEVTNDTRTEDPVENPDDLYNDPDIAALREMGPIPESVIAPQVRFIDGKIVLDEQSLEVDRIAIFRNPEEEEAMEVVEESRHTRLVNSLTWSKRRKKTKRWTPEETALFFKSLSQWGTDFEIIAKIFPGRNRNQIKSKYKRECKLNMNRVNQALDHKIPIDLEDYSKRANMAFPEYEEDDEKATTSEPPLEQNSTAENS